MSADVADLQVCLFTIINSVMWPTCIVADDTAQSLKQCCCGCVMCRYHDKQHKQYKMCCKPALPLADVMIFCAVQTMNSLVPSGVCTASVLTKASFGFMQVATHSHVLLFDMLRLQDSQALDTCLTSLLQSSSIVKLGCRLLDDVSKLHRSYPGMQAFQQALALLDVTGPWSLYMQTYNSQVSLVTGLLQQRSAGHMQQRARVSTASMNYAVLRMHAFLLLCRFMM